MLPEGAPVGRLFIYPLLTAKHFLIVLSSVFLPFVRHTDSLCLRIDKFSFSEINIACWTNLCRAPHFLRFVALPQGKENEIGLFVARRGAAGEK